MLELTLPSDFFEKEEKTQLSVQISEALLPQVEIQGGDLQSTLPSTSSDWELALFFHLAT